MIEYRLAKEIGVPAQRIGDIVAGKRSITADTDLRLCKFFGLSKGYWLRAQVAHDTEVAETALAETKLKVTGDLGRILANGIEDADSMYYNDGKKVSDKYGYGEKQALYNWWNSFNEMEKDLKRQKKFKEAGVVAMVVKKAVETSYNYYGIEPQKITQRFGLVIFSLIFYVIYTMWYGFAFMYMFEGWGMKLGH